MSSAIEMQIECEISFPYFEDYFVPKVLIIEFTLMFSRFYAKGIVVLCFEYMNCRTVGTIELLKAKTCFRINSSADHNTYN